MWSLALLLACGSPEPEPSPPGLPVAQPAASPSSQRLQNQRQYWPKRTDLELDSELRAACRASLSDGKPILIAFSAPWCPDCRRMRELEQQPALQREQQQWHKLVVDVGRFDQHDLLRAAFAVDRIVTWVTLQPTQCGGGPDTWPLLQQSAFEPVSGAGPKTADSLAAWLRAARTP